MKSPIANLVESALRESQTILPGVDMNSKSKPSKQSYASKMGAVPLYGLEPGLEESVLGEGRNYSSNEWLQFVFDGAVQSAADRDGAYGLSGKWRHGGTDFKMSSKLVQLGKKFEDKVYEALKAWGKVNPEKMDGFGLDSWASDVFAEGFPADLFMTFEGEGAGIWDGDFDRYFHRPDWKKIERDFMKLVGREYNALKAQIDEEAYDQADSLEESVTMIGGGLVDVPSAARIHKVGSTVRYRGDRLKIVRVFRVKASGFVSDGDLRWELSDGTIINPLFDSDLAKADRPDPNSVKEDKSIDPFQRILAESFASPLGKLLRESDETPLWQNHEMFKPHLQNVLDYLNKHFWQRGEWSGYAVQKGTASLSDGEYSGIKANTSLAVPVKHRLLRPETEYEKRKHSLPDSSRTDSPGDKVYWHIELMISEHNPDKLTVYAWSTHSRTSFDRPTYKHNKEFPVSDLGNEKKLFGWLQKKIFYMKGTYPNSVEEVLELLDLGYAYDEAVKRTAKRWKMKTAFLDKEVRKVPDLDERLNRDDEE